jgi:hypothetical protein
MERKRIVSGFVSKVNVINDNLSLVCVNSFSDEEWKKARVFYYGKVQLNYLGKPVDIITERKGTFSQSFEQKIVGSDYSENIEMSCKKAFRINKEYDDSVFESEEEM